MKKVSDFVTRFKQLMDASDIKQIDLVKPLGISNATISRYLSGSREPVCDNVERIAKYFNVEIPWLMGYEEDAKPIISILPPECQELECICSQLNQNGIDSLLKYARLLLKDDEMKKGHQNFEIDEKCAG